MMTAAPYHCVPDALSSAPGRIHTQRFSPMASGSFLSHIEEAKKILDSDLQAQIALPEIAEQLHISYESFRKQFTHFTGMSPGSYRRRQRLRQAALMLRSGMSVKETAALTGYADTYAFTREFKKAWTSLRENTKKIIFTHSKVKIFIEYISEKPIIYLTIRKVTVRKTFKEKLEGQIIC